MPVKKIKRVASKRKVSRAKSISKAHVHHASWGHFAKHIAHHIIHKRISPMIAWALVVFAIGSVSVATLSGTFQAQADQFATATTLQPTSKVLGLTINSYNPLTLYKSKFLTLTVTPVSYSQEAGKWDYKIDWSRATGRSGSISLNGKVVAADASGTGSTETGYILNANSPNRVVFYAGINGKGGVVVSKTFKTLPAEVAVQPISLPTTPAASSTDHAVYCTTDVKLCPGGSYVSRHAPSCEFAACPSSASQSSSNTNNSSGGGASAGGGPSYGYQ